MNDEKLRKSVKLLKATGGIKNYNEIAELLEMSKGSLYNWLKGYYNLGYAKKQKLKSIIQDLTIE